MVHLIGEAAGKVWSYLDQNGGSNLTQIKKGVKGDANLILQAIGWLAREDKLNIEKKRGSHYLFTEE
jgi:Winged helix-turn-helix domain (DUF2582)